MSPPVASNGQVVVRVLFQVLKEGDRKKMLAASNVTPSGGGARDLRFRPESEFLPFFAKLLPNVVFDPPGSSNIKTCRGHVVWDGGSAGTQSKEMEVWRATDARPGECRIARIHEFDFSGLVKDDPRHGRSIFMLFQQQNGVVRVHFTTETSLKTEPWNPVIKKFAVDWLAQAAAGAGARHFRSAFLDLTTNDRFPADA